MKFGEELATAKQKEYIKSLCEQTYTDPDKFNFATMTKTDASKIIDILSDKL